MNAPPPESPGRKNVGASSAWITQPLPIALSSITDIVPVASSSVSRNPPFEPVTVISCPGASAVNGAAGCHSLATVKLGDAGRWISATSCAGSGAQTSAVHSVTPLKAAGWKWTSVFGTVMPATVSVSLWGNWTSRKQCAAVSAQRGATSTK